MRTTLDIDADVLEAARELAAAERRSLGSVISELAARADSCASRRDRRAASHPGAARDGAHHAADGAPRARRELRSDRRAARRQRTGRARVGFARASRADAERQSAADESAPYAIHGEKLNAYSIAVQPSPAARSICSSAMSRRRSSTIACSAPPIVAAERWRSTATRAACRRTASTRARRARRARASCGPLRARARRSPAA